MSMSARKSNGRKWNACDVYRYYEAGPAFECAMRHITHTHEWVMSQAFDLSATAVYCCVKLCLIRYVSYETEPHMTHDASHASHMRHETWRLTHRNVMHRSVMHRSVMLKSRLCLIRDWASYETWRLTHRSVMHRSVMLKSRLCLIRDTCEAISHLRLCLIRDLASYETWRITRLTYETWDMTPHTFMSHTNESWVRHIAHTCEWVMSHTHVNESCHTHMWMSHVTHTCEWVMSHTHVNESCHTHMW